MVKYYQPNGPQSGWCLREWPDDMTREICHISIVKPYIDKCPAELALEVEGIKCDVRIVSETHSYEGDDTFAYCDHIEKLWGEGKGFINLEHDVVPWPGGLDELWNCEQPCCRFQYPVFPPGSHSKGIGCVKFSEEVVQKVNSDEWCNQSWWDLDGTLMSSIKGAGFTIHEHRPLAAHVRLRSFTTVEKPTNVPVL